eukprot:TRINITY_DN3465_c1_g4_i1.p1 TRINITY_DN3465_c1_g4~~TRINITY_DN3465_c1_g4_i1.p1  ORF type:complete len:281 (-),score=15.86 TRINITY_DN3465_c1_g4_i1:653-1495(-)
MVSLKQHIRGNEATNPQGYQLIRSESQSGIISLDEHTSFVSDCYNLDTPRRQMQFTFNQMQAYVNGIGYEELNGWTSQKIWQFSRYLIDRLQNARAYRGYFTCFLQMIESLIEYMVELTKNQEGLVRGEKRHNLVIALMCVQALNKAYGRRADVRASCHVLAQKVANDFSSVGRMLSEAMLSINPHINLPLINFVVPRTNRQLLGTLLEFTNHPQSDKPTGVLRLLEQFSVHVNDFTYGDIEWLESELAGAVKEHMLDMVSMLSWLLYSLRPNQFPKPCV